MQMDKGRTSYLEHCASCHNPNFSGGIGPELTGSTFFRNWHEKGAAQLADKIWTTMPLGSHRSLKYQTVINVVSYWYSQHGYSPGSKGLSNNPKDLEKIPVIHKRSFNSRAQLRGQPC